MKKMILSNVLLIWILVIPAISAWGEQQPIQIQKASEKPLDSDKEIKAPTAAEIEKIINDLSERISKLKNADGLRMAEEIGVSRNEIQERRKGLMAVQSAYERLLTATNKKVGLEKDEALQIEKLGDPGGASMAQRPPYSFSFYDNLLGELTAVQQGKETLNLAVKLSKRSLENATVRMEKIQADWRRQKDLFESQLSISNARKSQWDLGTLKIEKDLVEVIFLIEKANLDNLEKEKRIVEYQEKLYRSQVDWVRRHLIYEETDFNDRLKTYEAQKTELKQQTQAMSMELKKVEEDWLKAQKNLAVVTRSADTQIGEVVLRQLGAWRKTYQTIIEETEDMLRLIDEQEKTWRFRNDLVRRPVKQEELQRWKNESQNQLNDINRLIKVHQDYQTALQSQLLSIESQLDKEGSSPRIQENLHRQLEAFRRLSRHRYNYISMLLSTDRMYRQFMDEIYLKLQRMPWNQRLKNLKIEGEKIWNYEIWVIDNRAVTVRKLVIALFILIIGIFAAKIVIRILSRRLIRYARMRETTASFIQKVFTYFAYLLVLLFALRMVNIPLAAFAFLGGAIAIGLGFGAQNLINNFISGFIIMGERPISIGDLIEVEGILGQVEEIGARCTRVRTGENIHILVPNSSFLEKNITNWTLSDKQIRTRVTVGVIYGSPIQQVEALLLKSLVDNVKVHKKPEPFVIFNDFGDNALIFELYFWISITKIIERRLIESSVRFRIDELFRDAGIVIAFPQRDVHLDTHKPLELRLLNQPE
ncbi:MAG: mechanosensitive ion channel [Deltaproteobacteria bacterium]|nr:MAG: mechanosensitive ion channel [Deltaproteobacteria bacterium]